jgi:hypothetical protein
MDNHVKHFAKRKFSEFGRICIFSRELPEETQKWIKWIKMMMTFFRQSFSIPPNCSCTFSPPPALNQGGETWRRGWRQNCNERKVALSLSLSLAQGKRERGGGATARGEREIVRWQAIHHHPSCKNCQYHSFVVVSFARIKEWVKMGSTIFGENIFSWGHFFGSDCRCWMVYWETLR